MRLPYDVETEAENADWNDQVIVNYGGIDAIPPRAVGVMRAGPPCIQNGEHDWVHVPAQKKGIRQCADGSTETTYLDMEEHNECLDCGKWGDQAAFRRACEAVGMKRP